MTGEKQWDAFISHAHEDKADFIRPLAERLRARGLKVWFDEHTLTMGDSLRRSIDRGLANSRFGIVVISPSFLRKEWPQWELDGLVAREVGGEKVILPIWHQITEQIVRQYSPPLADRLAARSADGLDRVVNQIMQAIDQANSVRAATQGFAAVETAGAQDLSWDFERPDNESFLGTGALADFVPRVWAFQAYGENRSGEPILEVHAHIRSDLTNETKKVFFVINGLRADPADTNGIIRDGDFQVASEPFLAADGSEGMPAVDFRRDFGAFTFVFEYDGKRYTRQFTRNRVEMVLSNAERRIENSRKPPGPSGVTLKSK